jgi:hypothetical protein
MGRDKVRFEVERTSIEPFDLQAPKRYDLVIDRLTHWYPFQREWIKKSILLDGTYVFNNPWSVQSMEKHTTYCAMMALGIPIPKTALIPPKEYEPKTDLNVTLQRYAKLFNLGQVGEQIGYPAFMKPYDGGGWQGVSKVDDEKSLWASYDASGKSIMHLQAGIVPYDSFVRCIGFGPQTKTILYDPSAPLHILLYVLMILFFCFFYTSITFNPDEVADNMKKYGGFIPGIRAGRPTAEYLDYVITRITSAGAIYLALVALLPTLVLIGLGVSTNIPFGGSSIIIVVGVGLETVKQINSQLQQRHYEGFLR